MRSADKMTSKVEQSVHRRVDSQKSLCLCCRLESPHPAFSDPGWLM